MAGLLLVLAVAVALASLLSWRDFGTGLNPDESGWVMADGTLGRGWVAIAIAILLAAGGALLVAGRRRLGLILARIGAVALIVFPAIEWSFGMRNTTSGPGLGLWVLLVIGAAMILFMGTILGEDPDSNSH